MGREGTVIVVKEPLRGLVDGGDAAALAAYLALHPATDLCQPYDDFRTPSLAHRALDLGHEACFAVMLARGGDRVALIAGLHGATLAHVAARRGRVDALRAMLRARPDTRDAVDALGWAPLHDAAMEGRVAAVEYLVRAGADADVATHDGQRAADLARTSTYARAPAVAAFLDEVRAAGGVGKWVGRRRYPLVRLRALASRGRAAPCLVLHPDAVAFGAFLFPRDGGGGDDAAARARGLPARAFRAVLRFLV